MRRLYVAHGRDAAGMARMLLEAAQPEKGLPQSASVCIKPNLVVAQDWRGGATTNPAVCEAVIRHFRRRGFRRISVIESAWLGADTRRAFKVCGYEDLAARYDVELVDVRRDALVTCEYGGLAVKVSRRALEADCLINLPLIKGHCQTGITCALKNLKGLISDSDKRRFHTLGLHRPIAYLNRLVKPALTIADGTWADPSFEEGGNPVCLNTMVAGTDSVLIDAFAAGLLGRRASDIAYIGLAETAGVGSAVMEDADIVHLGEARPAAGVDTTSPELEAAKAHIDAADACSVCYASLLGALMRLMRETDIGDLRVCVGQGMRGKKGAVGSGQCASGCELYIAGCPPRTDKIYDALLKFVSSH